MLSFYYTRKRSVRQGFEWICRAEECEPTPYCFIQITGVTDLSLHVEQTDVVVDVYALHLRNPFWGEDRLRYRPQRFKNLSKVDVSSALTRSS
jgi:hypothetical protein